MEIQILDLIQKCRTPLLDRVMPLISALGNNGILWIVLAVLLFLFKKTRKIGLIIGAALILQAIICNLILKPMVARIRPCDVSTAVQLLIKRPADYSFPSGHTSAAFASTVAIFCAGEKKLGVISLILTILIAFSRMYLYVHYPTDVVGGMILGMICGWLGFKIMGGIISRKQATDGKINCRF